MRVCVGGVAEADSPVLCDPCEVLPCSRKQMGQWALIVFLPLTPAHYPAADLPLC